jgi:hypothetical protein
MEKSNESAEHKELVDAMIKTYRELGYIIMAAADGPYNEPKKVGRHAPDIVAKQLDGLLHICEAEVDNFTDPITIERFRDFSSCKMQEGPRVGVAVPLDIIIPDSRIKELNEALSENGISGSNIKIWAWRFNRSDGSE